MRCRGKFAEVRWLGRSRNHTHRKDMQVCHYRRGKLGKHQELEVVDLSPTWTLSRNAVTCPKCRALLDFERLEGQP